MNSTRTDRTVARPRSSSALITRAKAFSYAFAGIREALMREVPLKVHFVALVLVLIIGGILDLEFWEWLLISLCAGAVIATELINTAIEKLCDLVCADDNPAIKYIKDVSAGAVLVAVVAACLVASIIGYRHL